MMTSWSCLPIWLKRVFQVVALLDSLASIVIAAPPQSVLNAMSYLLTVFCEIAQTVAFPFGSADLCFHAGGDAVSKYPNLRAFAHQGISKEQPQLTLLGIAVIEELRKEQMRRNGDIALVHSEAAILSSVFDIGGNISGIG